MTRADRIPCATRRRTALPGSVGADVDAILKEEEERRVTNPVYIADGKDIGWDCFDKKYARGACESLLVQARRQKKWKKEMEPYAVSLSVSIAEMDRDKPGLSYLAEAILYAFHGDIDTAIEQSRIEHAELGYTDTPVLDRMIEVAKFHKEKS